jgi:hypothetical protein
VNDDDTAAVGVVTHDTVGAEYDTVNDADAAVDDTFRLSVTVNANVCNPFDIADGLIVNEPPNIDVDPLDQHPVDDEYTP